MIRYNLKLRHLIVRMKIYPKRLPAFFSIVLLLLFAQGKLRAQQPREHLIPLSQRPTSPELKTLAKAKKQVVPLPFFDDFSENSSMANPALWQESTVFINQTWAITPITLGVATFEGLDEAGFPHKLNGRDSLADVLVSQPVDISNPAGKVFLSFFWQEKGLGEAPSSADSLAVQVFTQLADSSLGWKSIWSRLGGGTNTSTFNYATVEIDSQFYSSNFTFRFASYGNRKGAFDFWHVDRVLLDDGRTKNDSLGFNDVAFTKPAPSLLSSYTAVPWFHYSQFFARAENRDRVNVSYRQHLAQANIKTVNLGEYTITEGGNLLDNGNAQFTLSDGHQRNEDISFAVPDVQQAPKTLDFELPNLPRDTAFTIVMTHSWDGSEQSSRSANDTIRHFQHFENYYAYDDGSAERGLEITDNANGFLLNRYDVQAGSSARDNELRGLYIYFIPSVFDVSKNRFSIVIREDNGGLPGNIIYESDSLYAPRFTAHNYYWPYVLDTTGISLNGPVYIGFRQINNDRLPVGFDLNTTGLTTAFFGEEGNLFQSFIPGAIMMRPFFRHLPANISLPEPPPPTLDVEVFPNPVKEKLRVLFDNHEHEQLQYQVLSQVGQVLVEGKTRGTVNLSALKPGLYLLNLNDGAASRTFKIQIAR